MRGYIPDQGDHIFNGTEAGEGMPHMRNSTKKCMKGRSINKTRKVDRSQVVVGLKAKQKILWFFFLQIMELLKNLQ